MAKTEAQKRANAKFESKAYSKILLRLRNDAEPTRDQVARAADQAGESLNEYIVNAIKNRMNGSEAEPIPEIIREPYYD